MVSLISLTVHGNLASYNNYKIIPNYNNQVGTPVSWHVHVSNKR